MLAPISSKAGFMIFSGTEIPLYFWSISSSRERATYRTSNSNLYPRRPKGLNSEQIQLRGAGFGSPLSFLSAQEFKIGWIETVAGTRKLIDCWGMIVEDRLDIDYTAIPSPAFFWTNSLVGIVNSKLVSTETIPIVDSVLCPGSLCENADIITTDSAILGGLLQYIKKASIVITCDRAKYYTSNSASHQVFNKPVFDITVDLEIEGGFDYWLVRLGGDVAYDYKFYYGSGVSDYWAANSMKVLSVSNFTVNIQTGEMISASVRLGIAV